MRLRPLEVDELPLVARWLSAPHVARWFLAGSSVERELDGLRAGIAGSSPVHVLTVLEGDEPIGWCQWYPCAVDPYWAADVGAAPGDVGIDYAIGDPARVGRGVGTALVAALVDAARAEHPGCAVTSDPDERNVASRRVLEKNGFRLLDVIALRSEPTDDPVAIYRLPMCDADDGSGKSLRAGQLPRPARGRAAGGRWPLSRRPDPPGDRSWPCQRRGQAESCDDTGANE